MASKVKVADKDYMNMCDKWMRCRAASAGQDAVHAGAELFLPRLADQSVSEYNAYTKRALFYNATWRTIAGLQGMLFRKPITVDVPAVVQPLLDNVSLTGENLHMFTLETVEECLTLGRIGLFADYPQVDVAATTAADAKARNLRPLLKRYKAESILRTRTGIVNNATVLMMVVLQEAVQLPDGEFDSIERLQYRVLDLVQVEDTSGLLQWQYRVRVYIVDKDDNDQLIEGPFFPVIAGVKLDYIPFYCIGVDSVDVEIDNPPLIDLVDINMSHYRTMADYEHGCHFTGLPTPVISGYTPDRTGEKFSIGSMTAWVFPRVDAKASFLEFKGEGLGALERNLTRKEQQMAILGARMLESQMNTGDSGQTTQIHLGGEQSMLASIATAVSIGMQKVLTTFTQFAGSTDPVKFELNKDFLPMPMSPLALTALVAGWQNGAYGYETLFNALKRGEVIDVDQTVTAEIASLTLHPAPIPAGTRVNQANAPVHETTMPTNRQLQTP